VNPQLDGIVREFESASARLRTLHRDVPPDRWPRRPAPESWSAGECIVHLNLTGAAMLPLLREGIARARQSGRAARRRYRRGLLGWLLWRGLSSPGRFKTKTVAAFVPTADRPADEVVAEFERLQAAQIAVARDADGLPIDRVQIASPFNGRVRYNVFAALSILARHQHRHLWQAERVVGSRQ
jgi:hypothetical protein